MKGDKAGRFTLDRRISKSGAPIELWKARDGETTAAVKLFTEPGAIASFRQDGVPQTAPHANVAQVLGADPQGTPPWLAQEFVEGPTLRELLVAQRYLPLSGAIPCLIQLLRGLTALHQAKLAHLDLRPENVMLDEKGALKLVDAATEASRREVLARLFEKRHPRPLPPEVASRLKPYAAPELAKLAQGRPADSGAIAGAPPLLDGPRADVYAFGVIAYEVATGERPPEGFDLKLPSQKDKRIPKVIDELVLRCLERSTRARPATAAGLEPTLLEGLDKAGFQVFLGGEPQGWVRGTPWRKGSAVGEETGRYTSAFKKLADEKR